MSGKTTGSFTLILFTLFTASAGYAASSNQIIDGFSEFMIERANANLTAVFEKKLKEDKNFQCYFPKTHEKISTLSLENLFASKNYWENSLNEDLKSLAYRSILAEAQKAIKGINRNAILEAIQYIDYVNNGNRYPINAVPLGVSVELQDQINGFTIYLADAVELADSLKNLNNHFMVEDVCQVAKNDREDLKTKLQTFLTIGEKLSKFSEHINKYGKNLRVSRYGKQKLYCDVKNISAVECETVDVDDNKLVSDLLVLKYVKIAVRINQVYEAYAKLDHAKYKSVDAIVKLLPLLVSPSFTQKDIEKARNDLLKVANESDQNREEMFMAAVVSIKSKVKTEDPDARHVLDMLRAVMEDKQAYSDRALVALELLKDSDLFDSNSLEHLTKSVMFFASIADADNKDSVKAILETYVMPPVSFAEKRKAGSGVFVSSYFGVVAARTNVHHSTEEASRGGLFVPIGIEYNYGNHNENSWSVMLSPVDLAYPVNLKLNGIEQDVELKEIMAPSVVLTYGVKGYPLNVGVGYQWGRKLVDVNRTETRYLLFVSFDIPLFRLY